MSRGAARPHHGVVKRWIPLGAVAAAFLVAGLTTLLVVSPVAGSEDRSASHGAAATRGAEHDEAGEAADDKADEAAEPGEAGRSDKDHGPPPWARSHDHGWSADAKAAWQKMSGKQRGAKMKQLAAAHAKGMRQWTSCVAAGRQDCMRPVPPGLAMKAR